MSEEIVIRHCAPTLAGIKTGSLFSCSCPSKGELLGDLRRLNRALVPKGLRALPLRYVRGRALIYVFRPAGLERDLSDRDALHILKEEGYPEAEPGRWLPELIRRLNAAEAFPHEIGLFLSYPPEDVRGFIENRGEGCKCIGCWKVYGDETRARRLFTTYKRCTESYCRQWNRGIPLERLTVAA
ncbi:MAG: DUF3793 family protein [Clostridia bacterium]|nr:DUF3793 family protein [Clostridia bacterium]